MFDKLRDAVKTSGDTMREAARATSSAAAERAESSTRQAIVRALNVMELAAEESMKRPAIKDVTVTAELNLVVGQISISATFDPAVLRAGGEPHVAVSHSEE